MIEKIYNQKKLYALIVRNSYRKRRGVNFFTDKKATQQFGYMNHKKNHLILPHRHNKRQSQILLTTEVIIILDGILRVDFYNNKEKYMFSKKLYKDDLIMLSNGGHGFKALKDIKMIEVKQGPYSLSMDKVKFAKVDEKKIKIR
ncbi:hypothetical protein OAP78_06770 [Candidatus Pelagibacter sp.]|nr:hypothetical protein [Candidatus Pelagibacter sp.]